MQIRQLAETYDSEHSSRFSDQPSDDEGAEVAARANFLAEKRTSERKASATEEIPEGKHVGFSEDVSTIPAATFADDENSAVKDDDEALKLKQPVPVLTE